MKKAAFAKLTEKVAYTIVVSLLSIATPGCNQKDDSQSGAIMDYQNKSAHIGWDIFNISEEQRRNYERKIDMANVFARRNNASALALVEGAWDVGKERDWSDYRDEINHSLEEVRSEIATNLPTPPKGCEMLSQQLMDMLKATEGWKAIYAGSPVSWGDWEQQVSTRYKEANFEYDKFNSELLRDIAPAVKEPFEGTFGTQSLILGETIEMRLLFRRTGCVILGTSPFTFRRYSVSGDRITVFSADGSREIFKKDGSDLLLIESYDKAGKKEQDHKMRRFDRIISP